MDSSFDLECRITALVSETQNQAAQLRDLQIANEQLEQRLLLVEEEKVALLSQLQYHRDRQGTLAEEHRKATDRASVTELEVAALKSTIVTVREQLLTSLIAQEEACRTKYRDDACIQLQQSQIKHLLEVQCAERSYWLKNITTEQEALMRASWRNTSNTATATTGTLNNTVNDAAQSHTKHHHEVAEKVGELTSAIVEAMAVVLPRSRVVQGIDAALTATTKAWKDMADLISKNEALKEQNDTLTQTLSTLESQCAEEVNNIFRAKELFIVQTYESVVREEVPTTAESEAIEAMKVQLHNFKQSLDAAEAFIAVLLEERNTSGNAFKFQDVEAIAAEIYQKNAGKGRAPSVQPTTANESGNSPSSNVTATEMYRSVISLIEWLQGQGWVTSLATETEDSIKAQYAYLEGKFKYHREVTETLRGAVRTTQKAVGELTARATVAAGGGSQSERMQEILSVLKDVLQRLEECFVSIGKTQLQQRPPQVSSDLRVRILNALLERLYSIVKGNTVGGGVTQTPKDENVIIAMQQMVDGHVESQRQLHQEEITKLETTLRTVRTDLEKAHGEVASLEGKSKKAIELLVQLREKWQQHTTAAPPAPPPPPPPQVPLLQALQTIPSQPPPQQQQYLQQQPIQSVQTPSAVVASSAPPNVPHTESQVQAQSATTIAPEMNEQPEEIIDEGGEEGFEDNNEGGEEIDVTQEPADTAPPVTTTTTSSNPFSALMSGTGSTGNASNPFLAVQSIRPKRTREDEGGDAEGQAPVPPSLPSWLS